MRKSLLVGDRSSGRTRFSMLETIRQFAEDQLAAGGEVTEVRDRHARYFAGREANILALWDSPLREAYDWFTAELANLRTAFRRAADHGDLDEAATIATYAAFLGSGRQLRADRLGRRADRARRRRRPPPAVALYVIALVCYLTGRIEAAVGYGDAAQTVIGSGRGEVPFGLEGMLGGVYVVIGQPERRVELCRAACGRDAHAFTRAFLVVALTIVGSVTRR